MMDHTPRRFTAWSVQAYRLVVQAYPYSFRREYGESMIQVFSDSARDAWRHAGLAGLAALWMRTIADAVRSVIRAYAAETRDSGVRFTCNLMLVYLLALAAIVAYGAIRFGEFYPAPAFSRFGAPEAHEAMLLQAFEEASRGEFGSYRLFITASGFSLAVFLGFVAAQFGYWQRSVLHAAGALAAGAAITIAALHLLPTVWFPLDRYPAAALWIIGGGAPAAAGTCALVLLVRRFGAVRTGASS